METLAKYLLLVLLTLPFVALVKLVRARKSSGLVIPTGVATAASCMVAFTVSFGRYPHVANVFVAAGLIWLLALLVAKAVNPTLPWKTLWMTVPIMSWYTVNVSMRLDYPVHGGGGGLGMGMGLILGWFYLVVPFALLQGMFIGGQLIRRRFRSGWREGD